jgi:hypothetical protein
VKRVAQLAISNWTCSPAAAENRTVFQTSVLLALRACSPGATSNVALSPKTSVFFVPPSMDTMT